MHTCILYAVLFFYNYVDMIYLATAFSSSTHVLVIIFAMCMYVRIHICTHVCMNVQQKHLFFLKYEISIFRRYDSPVTGRYM